MPDADDDATIVDRGTQARRRRNESGARSRRKKLREARSAFGFSAHRSPQMLDIGELGGFSADRHAYHPTSVEDGRREICDAGSIEAIDPGECVTIERVAFET